MIIKDEDAIKRLASPMNLINQLRSKTPRSGAMSLFGIGRQAKPEPIEKIETKQLLNPFQPARESTLVTIPQQAPHSTEQAPALDNILENHESQIKLGLAHDNALRLLNDSISALSLKLEDVKADKLPSVISAASKTVESIRRERAEATKNGKDQEVHFHFYTPQQKQLSDYEVIEVEAQVQ